MKRLILVICLITVAAGFAAAQSQWDLEISVPYYVGDVSGDFGEVAEFAFLLPNVKWHYYFGPEWLHIGVGFKLWTLIVESALYPIVSVESVLAERVVLNAGIGGGVVFAFGLLTDFFVENLFFPEFSAAILLGQRRIFSVGTGATAAMASGDIVFMGTVFARWTL